MSIRCHCWLVIAAVVSLFLCSHASAIEIDLARPGDREFVRDLANIITPEDEEKIQAICHKLLTDKATPIIVITIDSMANHGGEDLRIETFATLLFDQWGIGHAEINGEDWNTGILLLVSLNDRKARIELGGGWGRREDQLCRRIMDEQIIPRFKLENFSRGIVGGVTALDKMARKLELPGSVAPTKKRWSTESIVIAIVAAGLAIFTAVSLHRSGTNGWAWVFWGVVFAILGAILYQMANSRGGRGGGGGFSGGSFGGGSSGGGGATGSW